MKIRSLRRPVGFLVLAVLVFALSARAIEPGKFTFKQEHGRFSLEANQARVSDILAEISKVTGIPITLDPNDPSTATVSAAGNSLERIITQVSQGYAMVYAQDPKTKEYQIERIVAAGQGAAATAPLKTGELQAADVVRAIIARGSTVKRYHQRTTMSMNMMGSAMNMDGEMWMDSGKFRMETTMPPNQKQIIVSDGKTTYTYMPMMNMVQKMDMERIKAASSGQFKDAFNDPAASANPLNGMDPKSLKYFGTETLEGEPVYVLEGKMGGQMEKIKKMVPMMPESAKYWVSTTDGLPRKMVFHNDAGQEMMSQQFKSVVVNPKLDPGLFQFTVPKGAQVMDMTDATINMMSTMNAGTNAPPKP